MNAFDLEAAVYDDTFTQTEIGLNQRQRVHDYLYPILNSKTKLNILELNCGTGEDALHMANFGHYIHATDKSSGMLQVARSKAKDAEVKNIIFSSFDLSKRLDFDQKYDVIFSNFGGINCISSQSVSLLASSLSQYLNPHGSFIGVIMPKQTLLEKVYRTLKNQKEIFTSRSETDPIRVKVNDGYVDTYFFNPDYITNSFSSLRLENVVSVGYLPSYLEKSPYYPILKQLDRLFSLCRVPSKYADHFLIHLKKSA